MLVTIKLDEIITLIEKYADIEYRIINNTYGKNLILFNKYEKNLVLELDRYSNYIQEIIYEDDENEDKSFIKQIKDLCTKNKIIHRNTSYVNWNDKQNIEKIPNVIAGYSFKGGMGRSSSLAYLAYLYYLIGKKIVVLDCDFEAPGIASMFFERESRENKAGILDYLIDLNLENDLKLDDYFIQNEVSNNSGNLYLFPSGIDYDIENYINKISKIDFNSQGYISNFNKLLSHINETLRPDLIFIDLRAGLNESNGFILRELSSTNILFFNNEEQNEDGLKVILSLLDNFEDNIIMNSTIRFSDSEVRENKEKKFVSLMSNKFKKFKKENIISIPFNHILVENNINEFMKFIETELEIYKTTKNIYLKKLVNVIDLKYFPIINNATVNIEELNTIDLENIFKKLENVFLKLTGTEISLEHFYLKDDFTKIINEQIFLILGAKGSGKSTLFKVFTEHHQDILKNLNNKNNKYIAGFSKSIMNDISKDLALKIYKKSNHQLITIERFWKALTLFQLEKELEIEEPYFRGIEDIVDKFYDVDIGIEIDKKLKIINIDLLQNDRVITLVYDELDVGFPSESIKSFITTLVSFWQDNIYKFSQIRSKILLRNDIFQGLEIENKTHLELNKYELKWNEKEILSLILKIFISTLTDNELDSIGLLGIVKNRKNKEIIDDIEKIRESIYIIFDKKIASNRPSMDKWIMTRLSDSKDLITPRVIYKFMSESIRKELQIINNRVIKNYLLTSFSKNWEEILTNVSLHKLDEYIAEYKGYDKYYEKIKKIGQRSFTYEEFKKQCKSISDKEIKEYLEKLILSGFISINEKKYQVAYVYTYGLNLKINRSKTGLKKN